MRGGGQVNGMALPESLELEASLLRPEQRQVIGSAAREIEENPHSYDLGSFWRMDASIGGVGGYCMPFEPTLNPFPSGIGRELFRPLQYAAGEIDGNKNIYNTAKWAVLSSGQYLEAVTRYAMKKGVPLPLRPHGPERLTLGRSLGILADSDILPTALVKPSALFGKLYNKAKHTVNQDEERERLFAPVDALISYASARTIGEELLKPLYGGLLEKIGPYLGGLHNPAYSGTGLFRPPLGSGGTQD